MNPKRKTTVLVVDDSALVRRAVERSLAPFDDIEVVGAATDPYEARDLMLRLKPDVLSLDIEMPRMDGLTFLKLIMKHRPQPVVVMSSLTQQGSEVALRCLQEGAIDVIGKPSGSHSAHEDGSLLAHKLRSAAAVDMRRFLNHFKARHEPVAALQPVSVPATVGGSGRTQKLIAIGSSTGGTEALGRIFRMLPEGLPGMLIVQHIPAHFSGAFAARLNQIGRVRVKQSEEGDVIETGTALLAPGDHHMVVKPHGSQWVVSLNRGPRIHYQRPAVDVLFDSMARLDLGSRSLAILLTGMGSDGAAGMLKLREQGARTLAQDRHTCVVYGMPREAVMNGGAMKEVPLDSVPNEMVQFAQQPLRRALEAVS